MLKAVNRRRESPGIKISQALFPSPFAGGLEYCPPARGTWNIVHTGMLIPGAHEIFICAESCLRGVVLTAAEMGASDRFSCVSIRENNVLDGNMEELIVDGVADIINKLPQKPSAVLVYTSCIHHFMGCDLGLVYKKLGELFPDIPFTDCYMNPIMRKSGLTPDQKMRMQLYSLLKELPRDDKSVNIIGNDFATMPESELARLITESGFTLRDITLCRDYGSYLDMARSALNITYMPSAAAAGDELEKRLSRKHLKLTASFDAGEIISQLGLLADALGVPGRSWDEERSGAEKALKEAKALAGDMPVSIDYTAVMRPLSLARLLLSHGFNVERVYADSFTGEEKDDFMWFKENSPELMIYPTTDVLMRVEPRQNAKKSLAIGQKAAYFTGTRNFVNIVEGAEPGRGELIGFAGETRLAQLICEAVKTEKDTRKLIQIKGAGCGCCS